MRQWIAIGAAVGLVAVTLPMLREHGQTLTDSLSKVTITGPKEPRKVDPPPLTNIDLSRIDARREVATAPAHGKREATLTVVPKYQQAGMGFMRAGKVPEGAIVMTDVKTGRVLAWVSYVDEGAPRDVAAEASAPSASVFKVVTGSALLEAGLSPNTKQCYSGGEHSIKARDLVDDKKRDKYCATMTSAMGRSLNTVFARLALKNLDQEKLTGMAKGLGWADDIPFDVPIAQSTITLPADDLGFARSAAGFWNTTLSPFQAANLVTTIANRGEMIRLHVVETVSDEEGLIYEAAKERQVLRRAMDESTAAGVTGMMESTVSDGTSYRSFHDRNGKAYLPNITVAGKTGTLTKPAPNGPYYTWFVGFAPTNNPEVAIAVSVANGEKWRVKATNVACDMLRVYFADKGAPGVSDPNDPSGRTRAKAKK